MNEIIYVPVPVEEWLKENPLNTDKYIFSKGILAIDNEQNECCIISNKEWKFYKPTHVLVKVELPTNEEIAKRVAIEIKSIFKTQ